jgi:hypothetical protein
VKSLEHLWIDPPLIGNALGRLLFKAACTLSRSLGWTSFQIVTDANAEGFYLKLGARRIGDFESEVMPGLFLPLLEFQFHQTQINRVAAAEHF